MSQAPVAHPKPGCVVEIMQGNEPLAAWVLEDQGGKLRLVTGKQREMKIPVSRVLPWSGPCYPPKASRSEIMDALRAHEERRAALAEKINPLEIWDLAQGEMDSASIQWLGQLLWDDPDADSLAALGRSLLAAKTHFKFAPPDFVIHPGDKVENLLREKALAEERARLVSAGQAFFRELWKAAKNQKPAPPPPPGRETEKLKKMLLDLVADPEHPEHAQTWNQAKKGLPDQPHLPLVLAQAWGLVPKHHNYLLDRAGIRPGDAWSENFKPEIARIKDACLALELPADHTGFISIDSATTTDIDDAFFVRREQAGYTVSLALACPALCWPWGSDLDRAVAERASSLYLPEATHHMLPQTLGVNFFSLHQGDEKPSVILDISVDDQGEITGVKPRPARVVVAANRTYEDVDRDLDSGAAGDMLQTGFELAEKLRRKRLAAGAVIIEQAEPVVHLTGEDRDPRVDIDVKPLCPKSQLLVSELMILANTAAALWAGQNRLPMLFRTQNVTLPHGVSGCWTRPEDILRAVKNLAPTILEPEPKPHASLAVPAYAPISSPLRRYTDLVNMGQVVGFLLSQRPVKSRDELETMLAHLSSRIEAASQVQKFRTRYWKLVFFKQNQQKRDWKAVVADQDNLAAMLALPREQVIVRARLDILGGKVRIGEQYLVKLGKIDPLNNEIRVVEAVKNE